MRTTHQVLSWQETKETQELLWRAENGSSAPKKFIFADDALSADSAFRLASQGCAIFWQGDFQQAKQLLQALARRCDRKEVKADDARFPELFHLHRQAQSQRARILAMLLIPLNSDYTIPLRRAPNVVDACTEAYGESGVDSIVSLRELQALIGAHEWRKKGVPIPELEEKIYPHYGVFSPLRGEYISLVANTELPSKELAFDIGTGTGVLAAILARRSVQRIVATDCDPRALMCATGNVRRLGFDQQVEIMKADLFPPGKAPLIVCNPPWVPARPSSPIEYAIFDPESRMLRGFLAGLAEHLTVDGEGWLILSDFAEHLKLRTREELMNWISDAGLHVVERIDVKPTHSKSADKSNVLYHARCAEVTSLWRLRINT